MGREGGHSNGGNLWRDSKQPSEGFHLGGSGKHFHKLILANRPLDPNVETCKNREHAALRIFLKIFIYLYGCVGS